MNIIKLEWDSKFFNQRIGMLEIKENYDQLELTEKLVSAKLDFDLIYLFTPHALNVPGALLVDKKITYERHIDFFDKNSVTDSIYFDESMHDIKQLRDLAICSGVYSRFNVDKNFRPGQFEDLYIEWLHNSMKKSPSNKVFVVAQEKRIQGFVTLFQKNNGFAQIGLIAVGVEFRGRGVASDLLKHTLNYLALNDFKSLSVVTQQDNLPANSLYRKLNFIEKDIVNVYHYWSAHDSL